MAADGPNPDHPQLGRGAARSAPDAVDPPELSRIHRAVTGTFAALASPADAARYRLSEAQLAQFRADGFVGGIEVLDAAQVAQLRRRVDAICADLGGLRERLYEVEAAHLERPGEVVAHFLGGWMIDPLLHDLVFAPRVTVPLAQALGVDRLRFWHDQVFAKPPRHPGAVPWHQDYSYWTRTAPAAHVTINIVLDDTTAENGCLQFVPGSHRWGLLPMVPFDAELDHLLPSLSAEQRAQFAPVAVPLRAGQASIHHSHTVHGSGPNRSDRPRRALVLNYMAPDTRCADGSAPLLRGTAPIAAGAVVDGEHFPIALDLRG